MNIKTSHEAAPQRTIMRGPSDSVYTRPRLCRQGTDTLLCSTKFVGTYTLVGLSDSAVHNSDTIIERPDMYV